jgi:CheY-like chemotaxis protein
VPPHFLLVDDDADHIELFYRALDHIGNALEVGICHDGAEALDALVTASRKEEEHRPRFVVLDANMPQINGYHVLRKARTLPALVELPIVMFSTSSGLEEIERAYNLGATAYCVKPLHFDDLIHVVLAMLARWGGHVLTRARPLKAAVVHSHFRGPHDMLRT